MNKQLRHVSVVALVLLAVLIVSTTYWQTWAQADLADRKDNSVSLIARLTVDRGKFLGAGGPLSLRTTAGTASTASRSTRGTTRRTTSRRR